MAAKHAAENRKGYWRRILRPLYWWLLLLLVLYGIRLHQRLIEQTRIRFYITLQNVAALDAAASLDGVPVDSGTKISLGRHTFTIRHPKAELFSQEFFAWYGLYDLGKIQLKRSVGTLSFQANPLAPSIMITGPEFSTTLHEVTATNLTVPTDNYVVHAEYPYWSQSQSVLVSVHQSSSCTFAPRLGTVQITCNKEPATYRLEFDDGKLVGSGGLPATVTGLPTGSYQMIVGYHHQQIQKAVLVKAGETNEAVVQFLLGAAHLESDPVGAEVRDADGNSLGQTPLDIGDLKPQVTQLNLSLDGYQPVSLSLEITADQTNSCRTNLVNLRYQSAMNDAKANFTAGNYAGVIQAAGEALKIKPDDADALQLQTQANGILKAEQERKERLKRPKQVFDALCDNNPDSNLFDEHVLKISKPAKDVANAILKSLQAEPSAFDITLKDSTQPETYRIVAREEFSLGILGGSERLCLLVVGQAKDDETQIWFRVLEYQIQHTIEANGLFKVSDNKQMIPLHSSRMEMNDVYRERVREGVRLVTQKIERER